MKNMISHRTLILAGLLSLALVACSPEPAQAQYGHMSEAQLLREADRMIYQIERQNRNQQYRGWSPPNYNQRLWQDRAYWRQVESNRINREIQNYRVRSVTPKFGNGY